MLSSRMDGHRELSLQRAQLKIDVQSDEPIGAPARQDLWRRVEQYDFERVGWVELFAKPITLSRDLAISILILSPG
jgi:hypothetical protein